jgi:hypothetical protein
MTNTTFVRLAASTSPAADLAQDDQAFLAEVSPNALDHVTGGAKWEVSVTIKVGGGS